MTEKVEWPGNNQPQLLKDASSQNPEDTVERTMKVFGQVVADDPFGDVYIVPLAETLEDIKEVLAVGDIRLPESTSEIDSIFHNATERVNDEELKSMSLPQPTSTPSNKPTVETAAIKTTSQATYASRSIRTGQSYVDFANSKHDYWYTCCNCGGFNSARYSVGCVECHNHVRCSNCTIGEW